MQPTDRSTDRNRTYGMTLASTVRLRRERTVFHRALGILAILRQCCKLLRLCTGAYANATKVEEALRVELLGAIKEVRQIKVVNVVASDDIRISLRK